MIGDTVRPVRAIALAAVALGGQAAGAQDSVPSYVRQHYVRQDLMVPMRDGVRLRTIVFTPRDTSVTYPVLLTRTPYGADSYFNPVGPADTFARAGYIFAFQDVRGKYLSEGRFVDVPPSGGPIDESTDAYDAIDWLTKQLPRNNGRVGVYGISYLGYYSTMALLSRHPALKAVSPQAPVTDWFAGDDFHHNGAFFVNDAFDFESGFGVPRPTPTNERRRGLERDKPDEYHFFLNDVGTIANVNDRYFHHGVPFWDSIAAHPTYDAFWKARTPIPHLRDVTAAVLVVGGWFDAEDLWGTLAVHRALATNQPGGYHRLVMGPWWHAGWFLSDGHDFVDLKFPTKTADDYHNQIELPFFEHFLKDKGDLPPFEAYVYETGANAWRTFDSWPPRGVRPSSLYLGSGGRLTRSASADDDGKARYDEYVSDPAKPVPYMGKILRERPADYMVADQRFASERPDVLVYETDPLDDDLTIAGPITAHLFVSTTGTDADWVVKLIDVYPDDAPALGGYQQLVRAEVMRGKFRNSLATPVPFVPGHVTPITYTLPDAFHQFKRGHRVMVQIQSSWFPLVDRNPQRFVDIYHATAADFQRATQRVYHAPAAPSRVELPVLP